MVAAGCHDSCEQLLVFASFSAAVAAVASTGAEVQILAERVACKNMFNLKCWASSPSFTIVCMYFNV